MDETHSSHSNATGHAPNSAQRRLKPIAEAERIISLDVLRGVAILGIFLANMAFFAYPLGYMLDVTWLADESAANQFAWSAVRVFVDGKFITLFSILFGVGMMVQLMRAGRAEGAFAATYGRRLAVLGVFGLVHALLIWYGDILLMYAVCGFALLLVQRLSGRAILAWAAGLFIASLLMFLGMTALGVVFENNQYAAEQATTEVAQQQSASGEPEQAKDPAAENDAQTGTAAPKDDRFDRFWTYVNRAQFNPAHPAYAQAETIAYKEGPFGLALAMRAITYAGFAIFMGALSGFGLRIIAVFLLGAAMMKMGFFGAENRRWHWRCFIVGVGLGLPLEFAAMAIYHVYDFEMTVPVMLSAIVPWFSNIILALGYVGGVCLLVHAGALQWLQQGLAAVGRMALTNYLMQSAIATFIFYWWGLGLFGELGKVPQLTIAVSVYVGQIFFSLLWLRVFRFGPLEWLWRTLAYWKWQPMLRKG